MRPNAVRFTLAALTFLAASVAAVALARAAAPEASPPLALAAGAAYPSTLPLHPNSCAIADGNGGHYVAWSEWRAGGVHVLRLDGRGEPAVGWPRAGVVLAPNTYATNPALAPDSRGGVLVAFTVGYAAQLARLDVDGSPARDWPAGGVVLWDAGRIDQSVMPAPDGEGGAYFVIQSRHTFQDTSATVSVGHLDAHGALPQWWNRHGNDITTRASQFDFPEILADGHGGALVAYQALADDGHRHVRVTRATSTSLPAPGWPADGVLVETVGTDGLYTSSVDHPVMASDGSGGAYVAWTRVAPTPGYDLDVHLQHVRASGDRDPFWPIDGVPVALDASQQAEPRLVADGAGGAFVMIREWGYGLAVLHAASDGTIGGNAWPAGGLWPHWDGYTSSERAMSADGAGGVFVTWLGASIDYSHTAREAHVLHLTARGTEADGGSLDGRLLATTLPAGGYLNAAGDDHGGVLMLWTTTNATNDSSSVIALRVPGTDDVAAAVHAPHLELLRSGPNPTALDAVAEFAMPQRASVRAAVYTIDGRRVRAFGEFPAGPGIVRLRWDGRDDAGHDAPAGLYVLSAESNGTRANARIVRVR